MNPLTLIATLAAVAGLTAAAWGVRRLLWPRLCPLCAGVSATWIGLLALHAAGVPIDPRLPALLMGGSVVGLAGLGERALAPRGTHLLLVWKTGFVLVGVGTAMLLLQSAWAPASFAALLLAALLVMPWLPQRHAPLRAPAPAPTTAPAALMEQLKGCC